MQVNGSNKVTTIRNRDGSFTSTPEETLQELLDVLFPDKENQPQTCNRLNSPEWRSENLDLATIVNEAAIKAAINSFEPYKSPGCDGIYPALLQKGIEILHPFLQTLYRKSLEERKLPNRWNEIKAVFIPKPGKQDYTNPKSYRPISLSSFLLKGLERLIHWHICQTNIIQKPLHPNLYSYREGRSTENALHNAVHILEKAMANNNFAIAVFLDINGAFSNTSIEGMIQNLQRRNLHPQITLWIKHMLENRTVTATLHNKIVSKKVR